MFKTISVTRVTSNDPCVRDLSATVTQAKNFAFKGTWSNFFLSMK